MITIVIIAITSIISYMAFRNESIVSKYIFYPPAAQKQWYRFFTYGLLHADIGHLIFNMFALYLFGTEIEKVFMQVLGTSTGGILYILLYISALLFSILPTYFQEKNNRSYSSLGASGAVSAVVFAFILIYPMSFMGVIFVPIFLPAFIFGIIYILTSIYLEKKQNSLVNHLAHLAGGFYGVIFIAVVFRVLAGVNIFSHFIQSIHMDSISDLIHFGY